MATETRSPYQSKLYVPKASSRPDQPADFSKIDIPSPTASVRPAEDVAADQIRDLAYGLVRVLDDDGQAKGD